MCGSLVGWRQERSGRERDLGSTWLHLYLNECLLDGQCMWKSCFAWNIWAAIGNILYSQNNCLMWKKKVTGVIERASTWVPSDHAWNPGSAISSVTLPVYETFLELLVLSSGKQRWDYLFCRVVAKNRYDHGEKCHPPNEQPLSPLHCFLLLGTHPVQNSFLLVSRWTHLHICRQNPSFPLSLLSPVLLSTKPYCCSLADEAVGFQVVCSLDHSMDLSVWLRAM